MNILSIDVGIKNLAYCLVKINNNNYFIEKWGSINICDESNNKCCIDNCTANAKYLYKDLCYCLL